jgi:HK97 family phage portal protein
MSMLDRLLRPWKATPQPAGMYPSATGGSVPIAGNISFGGWPDRALGNQRTVTDAQRMASAVTSAWVYSDIRAIANELSSAELNIKEPTGAGADDQEMEIENHPFENLWVRPNPYMGRSFVMQYWTWQIELLGEAYLYFAPDATNPTAISEIWPVPSLFMTPEGDGATFIKRYKYQIKPDQAPLYIDPQFICYSRLPNPFDIRRGMSPLVAAYVAVETDKAMAYWSRDFFGKDNAVPTSIVSLPKDVTKPQYDIVKQELFEFFGSGQRRTAVIRAGDMDVKTISSLQKDMEFIGGRSFLRDEIDRIYGIPSGYWSGDANRANANHAKGVLIDNAVWPLLVMLSEDLNTQTIPLWYGDVTADFDDIRPRDHAMDLQELESHKTHWTIEELRQHDKKQPLNDWRDGLLLVQLPAGATTDPALTPPPMAPPPPQAPAALPAPDQTSPALDAAATPPAEQVPPALIGKAADLDKWERKALKALKQGKSAAVRFESEHFDGQAITALLAEAADEEAVKAIFRDALAAVGLPGRSGDEHAALPEDTGPHDHLKAATTLTPAEQALMDQISAILTKHGKTAAAALVGGSLPDLAGMSADLRAAIQAGVVMAAVEHATALAQEIGPDFAPLEFTNTAADWAETYTYDLVSGITETTATALGKAMSTYQRTPGMTRDALVQRIAPIFGDARAESIATTEITRGSAQGAAQYQDYLTSAGITMERVNQTNADDRVCAICGPLDGKAESEWPDDGGPPWHPQCRCAVALRSTEA